MEILSAILLPVIIFVAIGIVLLIFFVHKNNPKSATNRIFVGLSILTLAWMFVMYFSKLPLFESRALFWARMSIVLAVPIISLFFLLAQTLPSPRIMFKKVYSYVLLAVSVLLMGFNLTPYAFESTKMVDGRIEIIPGPGIAVFGIFAILMSVATIYILIRRFGRSEGIQREQFRWITMAVFLMFALIIATVLIPVIVFQNDSLVPLAPFYVFIFLALTAYTIIRHRFLDIRFILVRTLGFVLVFAMMAGIAAAFFFTVFDSLPICGSGGSNLFCLGGIVIATAFFLSPIERFARYITDKIYFRGHYDPEKLLAHITQVMVETMDLSLMIQDILRILTKEMRLTEVACCVLEENGCSTTERIGYENLTPDPDKLDVIFQEGVANPEILVFEGMEEGPLKDFFRSQGIQVAIPLKKEDRIALFILGSKASGETYYTKDLEFLKIFSNSAAIAIQNSRAYEKIKKMNRELETRVEERTQQLEASQKRELERVQEISKLKDEFLNITAHELKSPLMPISAQMQLLLDEAFGKVTKAQRESLEMMLRNVNALDKLVTDLLDVTRIRTKKFMLEQEKTSLDDVIQDTVDALAPRAKEEKITLAKYVNPLPSIQADPRRIEQVLMNLTENALKFTPEGGRVLIKGEQKDKEVVISVTDNGIGISEENQKKLFKPFFQVDASVSRKYGGAGLGLAICKGIVEAHGGKIGIESEGEGHGTTVWFSLPLE